MTWVCFALALASMPASASPDIEPERRVALLVAHPFGGGDLVPLRYTANDLERMRDVLQMLGGFASDDILTSIGEDAAQVRQRFAQARARLAARRGRPGAPTLFLFYYSGHAKDGELRLGDSRLPLPEIKRLLEGTGASLRVALLDACRAGSITLLKGAVRSEPIRVAVDESAMQTGQVLISASSEDEDAQESDDIQGSFFTHFLTSGLRGAADSNGDARVTLSEAYAYAYATTVSRTVGSRGGIQHPTFRFDMRGAGDVVLTRDDFAPHTLLFSAEIAGSFVLFDEARHVVAAELDKADGEEVRLAVRPGDYVLKKREADHVRLERVRVRGQGVTRISLSAMERVELADDYAKGTIISAGDLQRGRIGVNMAVVLGAQTFLSAPVRTAYLPALATIRLELALGNLLARRLGVRFDAGLGSSGDRTLAMHDPYLGDLDFRVRVSQLTSGLSLVYDYPITNWLALSSSGRLGFVLITREFLHDELPPQRFATLTPGLGLGLVARLGGRFSAGVSLQGHYMFFKGDEDQSLAYLDAGLHLAMDFR